MQVTIDTRHDTLEEALAVIQLAFSRVNGPPPTGSAGPRRAAPKRTAAKKSRSPKSAKTSVSTR